MNWFMLCYQSCTHSACSLIALSLDTLWVLHAGSQSILCSKFMLHTYFRFTLCSCYDSCYIHTSATLYALKWIHVVYILQVYSMLWYDWCYIHTSGSLYPLVMTHVIYILQVDYMLCSEFMLNIYFRFTLCSITHVIYILQVHCMLCSEFMLYTYFRFTLCSVMTNVIYIRQVQSQDIKKETPMQFRFRAK